MLRTASKILKIFLNLFLTLAISTATIALCEDETRIFQSQECENLGLEIVPHKPTHSVTSALSVTCFETETDIGFDIKEKPDRKWMQFSEKAKTTNETLSFQTPKNKVQDNQTILTFTSVAQDGLAPLTFSAIKNRKIKKQGRVSWNASLGPTYSVYTVTFADSRKNLSVRQYSITAKSQFSFAIVPRRFDIALSAFGTAYPIKQIPGTLPAARWLGFNARLGFSIPLARRGTRLISILPGFYAWSMFVRNDRYGVSFLNGPQIVIAYRHSLDSTAVLSDAIGGYIKYATVAPGGELQSLSNREVATGLMYDFATDERNLVLAVDFSTLTFGLSEKGARVRLDTLSASIGYRFF